MSFVVIDTAKDAHSKVKDAIRPVKYGWQRATRGYSDIDLWNLGDTEIDRLSDMMRDLAYETHGYPDGYDDPERWLVKRDIEEYKRQQNIFAGLNDVNTMKPTEHNTWTFPTNENVGLGASAWVDDLLYASDVLEEYSRLTKDMSYGVVFGREDEIEHVDRAHEEVKRVWSWIGRNLTSMWD